MTEHSGDADSGGTDSGGTDSGGGARSKAGSGDGAGGGHRSDSARRPRRRTRALTERLVELMAEGEHSPMELAQRIDLPLTEVVAWASQPEHVRILEGLARLADVRTQLVLCKYRANAAVQLINIATADEPTELARKACVDLLNADLHAFEAVTQGVNLTPSGPTAEAILKTLERMGESQT